MKYAEAWEELTEYIGASAGDYQQWIRLDELLEYIDELEDKYE